MIVRTNPKANPPHFRVIVNGEIWHVTHGRVNTFHVRLSCVVISVFSSLYSSVLACSPIFLLFFRPLHFFFLP